MSEVSEYEKANCFDRAKGNCPLVAASNAYYGVLGKVGQQALQSVSSRTLGDILIQISENQRRLTSDLDGVFRWFHGEVLQEMDRNVKLDRDYIAGSKRRYEMEVRNRASALEKQNSQLWGEKRRGRSQHEVQDLIETLEREAQVFLRESLREAEKEELRRYRFLAEKHCGLIQSLLYLINKNGASLQQQAEVWRERVNETRSGSHLRPAGRIPRPRTPSGLQTPTSISSHTSGNSVSSFYPISQISEREIDMERERQTRESHDHNQRPPSRGSSHSGIRSRSGSLGNSLELREGEQVQALVSHDAGTNVTLLSFSSGDVLTVLVPEAQNGWLYGQLDGTSSQGWFPAAYVQALRLSPGDSVGSRTPTMRSSHSTGDLLSQVASLLASGSSSNGISPPAPPPLPRPITPTPTRKTEDVQEDKVSQRQDHHPQLFPRGTNPFATVKLRPTVTNDRSAPRIK
ncbi:brain-specific angiogenesis inhibitor 1-associated protein 2-like protein 2 [Polypterus senegalus]|uniref:brain-specific angiogenesis inhibitor 1-associated protein 2-like protein 2 n=1 Tax=Polypterus senegalus TaxID=55291 RepID=UPI001962D15A|nr:brain-specific angiogenesis inhibitor 1-associated protein 2-like protein 2 [Polypterus senegalus]